MNIHFIAGASGSGKTSIMRGLQKILGTDVLVHHFDNIGVPDDADKKWRQKSTEYWLQKLLSYNKDACLLGQTVLGEILACPSTKQLKIVNLCLLDVSDFERINRLKKRNGYEADQKMLNWSSWLRMHHQDPRWMQHVIKEDSWEDLDFSKWDKLDSWASHANIKLLDTTNLFIEEVAMNIANWIRYS